MTGRDSRLTVIRRCPRWAVRNPPGALPASREIRPLGPSTTPLMDDEMELVPAERLRGAVEALEWLADRYATTLAGKPVRDADEALERARLIVNQARGQ